MRSLVLLVWAGAALASSACTYECTAANCADGCCGANGVCYVNGGDAYCGLSGAACQDCDAEGKLCSESTATCELACELGSSCEDHAGCCSSLRCIDVRCSNCLGKGEPCADQASCCSRAAGRNNAGIWVCE